MSAAAARTSSQERHVGRVEAAAHSKRRHVWLGYGWGTLDCEEQIFMKLFKAQLALERNDFLSQQAERPPDGRK